MENESLFEGFYLAYTTGLQGNGVIMLMVMGGKIIGSDVMGVLFDGNYTPTQDGRGFDATIKITAPAGQTLIQGVPTGPSGLSYEVKAFFPPDLERLDYLKIPTPFGSINARFKKLRGLNDA
ncbi:MAG: hypothetical protein ACR65U_11775 [Methylocystis sp.]